MQTATWRAFCLTGRASQSFVHFYPASPDVAAPYVVRCKLTMFGGSGGEKSVVLDGARLSQPDGVRLSDAFPSLGEEDERFVGLVIEIVSVQPRVNLGASACVIELKMADRSIKFRPIGTGTESGGEGGLCIEDPFNATSLVLVNSGRTAVKPVVQLMDCGPDGSPVVSALCDGEELPGQSVREIPLGKRMAASASTQECSWGLLRSTALFVERPSLGQEARAYLLYRDARTDRPLSVMPV